MPRVLVMSSMVARGHVGLSAIVPILQGLGSETVSLPTVLLSNHPGHTRFAGQAVPVDQLEAMLAALAGNGWLRDIDAVLSGYFPSAAHVRFAAAAIATVRAENPQALIVCDPVLGDDPGGLYVAEDVAASIRDALLPISQAITPNRFELEWLSGRSVTSPGEAVTAARALGLPLLLATSIPAGPTDLCNVAITHDDAWRTSAPRRHGVPHGTGDALSAAFLAATLAGLAPPQALGRAAGSLDALISASLGCEELQLVASRAAWLEPRLAEVVRI